MTIKVDLLPTERRGFRLDPMVIVLFMLVVLSTVGFAFYGQNLTQQIEAEKKKIEVVKAEIKQNEASRPIIEERRKRLRKLDEQIQIIKNLVHDPQRYGNLLQEVGMCLPQNVYLGSLSIEPGSQSITFAGDAAEVSGSLPLATISQLMKNLNESKYFSDATLSSASAVKGKGFNFSMSVRYDQAAAATLPPGTKDSAPAGGPGQAPPGQATPAPGAPATPAAPATPGASATPGAAATPGATSTPGAKAATATPTPGK